MEDNKIKILDSTLTDYVNKIGEFLEEDKHNFVQGDNVLKLNIYDAFKQFSSFGSRRNTFGQLLCLKSLEVALGTYVSVYSELSDFVKLKKTENALELNAENLSDKNVEEERVKINEVKELVNIYAMYAGAAAGLNMISHFVSSESGQDGKLNIDLLRKPQEIISDLAESAIKGLAKLKPKVDTEIKLGNKPNEEGVWDNKLLWLMDGFYKVVLNRALFDKEKYEHLMEKLNLFDKSIEVGDIILKGFSYSSKNQKQEKIVLDVGLDDIVGNQEFMKEGKDLVENLLAYDEKEGKNPAMPFPQILFAQGTPGCGKTVGAHALMNYFLKTGEENGIKVKVKIIKRTDWANEYQNKSANDLLKIFNDEVFNCDERVLVYISDIDTFVTARGGVDGGRIEEKNNLNVMFGILDGTIGPKNGKWALITDANFLPEDVAFLSRLKENTVTCTGPQIKEDYIKLFKDIKMKKVKNHLKLSEDDFNKFGETCANYKLSGRAIDQISSGIMKDMRHFEKADNFLKMSYAEKEKYIDQRTKDFGFEEVMKRVEDYNTFEKEVEERSARTKFEKEVKEMEQYIKFQNEYAKQHSQPQEGTPENQTKENLPVEGTEKK